ncbi:MAG: hypothetical protein H8F28_07045 [Fibrella sp.]|nr:hypothetical protein [Armatimonadota bacterium]
MDERRKSAYRHLLYHAVISIRSCCAWASDTEFAKWEAFFRFRGGRTAHRVHCMADAFHNVARYSALDFEGFDESKFWNQMAHGLGSAEVDVEWYRNLFDEIVSGERELKCGQ